MKCKNGIYGCYTCCYKFKVINADNWNLEFCPKCGSPTLVCLLDNIDLIKKCEGDK